MRMLAKLKLTKPNVARKIALSGKMCALFANAQEMSADIDWYAVYADAANPKAAVVEVKLKNADGFVNSIRQEKHFDCLCKFFDIMSGSVVKPWLNYIEYMCLLDGNTVYCMPDFCLTQPSAEDACIDINAELECAEDEAPFDVSLVAVWIRSQKHETDIVLPIYPRMMYATTCNTVEVSADTYDDSTERLPPDVYRPILDVIDDLIALKSPCQMLALGASAFCGNEIDISESAYPINRLCLHINRHGKSHSIVLDADKMEEQSR